MLNAQIAQRVRPDQLVDLLNGVAGGNQVLLVGNVGAEIARVGERRRTDPVVYLGSTGLAQQADGAGARRAADDGVIDQHNALALDRGRDGVQLDAHAALALGLAALNEGAAYIFVLDKAHAVGDTALLRIAERCIQTGVRCADDDIGLHGMLLRQEPARLQTGLMHTGALDDGIRAGEVDVLKDAHRVRRGAAVILHRAQAVAVGNNDLAGAHVTDELRTHGVQRTALAGKGIAVAVGQLADAQRAEAVGVTRRDQLGVGHNDEGVCALDVVHRAADGHLNVRRQQTVLGQQIGNDLGVRRAVKDRTAHLELAAQLRRVDKVAVVADRHSALAVMQNHRLRVGTAALARRGIADMAGSHLCAAGQLFQHALGKDLADKAQIAVAGQHAVDVQRNAAALLAAVLQGVQRTVDGADHIGLAGLVIHTEHAALLVQGLGVLGNFAHLFAPIVGMVKP